MSKKIKHTSLLRYWTSRYLLTLFVGLAILALISALWIRHTTLQNRLDMMGFMAEEMVKRVTNSSTTKETQTEALPEIPGIRDKGDPMRIRDIEPIIYIVDNEGSLLSNNPPFVQDVLPDFPTLIEKGAGIEQFKLSNDDAVYYAVKKEITLDDERVGWVIAVESKSNLTKVRQEYGQLAIGIATLALLGWGAIYFLSRRLSYPIKQVATAAKQVQEGNYKLDLPQDSKELEIYELIHSFQEMANRLEQLESTRKELLAGVTHELKTPVTSISGLLQAVKDGVVTGKDADDFIQMALVETTKMKTMVGDLLAFNTYSVNAIPVNICSESANVLIGDAISQWEHVQEHANLRINLHLLVTDCSVKADIVRVQQILTNLLTNAQQAMKEEGIITVTMTEKDQYIAVTVKDTGSGISEEDRPFVFERFYRGENKKYAIRGLGLGLPLSKMMAQSIGGDLTLVESSESGTTFELLILKCN